MIYFSTDAVVQDQETWMKVIAYINDVIQAQYTKDDYAEYKKMIRSDGVDYSSYGIRVLPPGEYTIKREWYSLEKCQSFVDQVNAYREADADAAACLLGMTAHDDNNY